MVAGSPCVTLFHKSHYFRQPLFHVKKYSSKRGKKSGIMIEHIIVNYFQDLVTDVSKQETGFHCALYH